jgi:hypothetical protein
VIPPPPPPDQWRIIPPAVEPYTDKTLRCDVCDEPVTGYFTAPSDRIGDNHPCGHVGVTSREPLSTLASSTVTASGAPGHLGGSMMTASSTAKPGSAAPGDVFHATDEGVSYVWVDGKGWVEIGGVPAITGKSLAVSGGIIASSKMVPTPDSPVMDHLPVVSAPRGPITFNMELKDPDPDLINLLHGGHISAEQLRRVEGYRHRA